MILKFISMVMFALLGVTGEWSGSYVFKRGEEKTPTRVEFKAHIFQKWSGVKGTTTEPNRLIPKKNQRSAVGAQPAELTATIPEMLFIDNHVVFHKQYNGEGGFNHVVRYDGIYDAEKKTITGQWRGDQDEGPFSMKLDRPAKNALSAADLGALAALLIIVSLFLYAGRRKPPPPPITKLEDLRDRFIY